MEFLLEIDRAVFLFFNAQLTNPIFDYWMPRITHFKFWAAPMAAVSVIFVVRSQNRKKAAAALILTAVAIGISDAVSSHVIKNIFARPRPCHPELFVEGGRFLLGLRGSYSFPSSHSMNMFTGAAVLYCFYPQIRYGAFFFSFAALIGYTRVYCGVHYPLDVLAGAGFGMLLGWGVYCGAASIYTVSQKHKIGANTKIRPVKIDAEADADT